MGELACGNLPARELTLPRMRTMWSLRPASDDEVLQLIEGHRLHGRGVGWIDFHLLTTCKLRGPSLWTRDKRLREVAAEVLGEEKVWV
ncbi:hypothetical protein [Phycisphaera mikurensis]|nr:hypothetical protein [Phycisphaera mikurensis]MBB6443002.1 hypothetical protein [Phycisphaera mikurensis]